MAKRPMSPSVSMAVTVQVPSALDILCQWVLSTTTCMGARRATPRLSWLRQRLVRQYP